MTFYEKIKAMTLKEMTTLLSSYFMDGMLTQLDMQYKFPPEQHTKEDILDALKDTTEGREIVLKIHELLTSEV